MIAAVENMRQRGRCHTAAEAGWRPRDKYAPRETLSRKADDVRAPALSHLERLMRQRGAEAFSLSVVVVLEASAADMRSANSAYMSNGRPGCESGEGVAMLSAVSAT